MLHNRGKNRQKETGGGVYKHMKTKTYSSFELTMVKVLSIYKVLFESITVFLEELIQLFTMLMTSNECIIIAGDVNIHTETDESSSKQFNNILDMFNFTQHIKFPTHKLGHTLDIVVTLKDTAVTNTVAVKYDLSHHFLVDFNITVAPEVRQYKTIYYRNIKTLKISVMTRGEVKFYTINYLGTKDDKLQCSNGWSTRETCSLKIKNS